MTEFKFVRSPTPKQAEAATLHGPVQTFVATPTGETTTPVAAVLMVSTMGRAVPVKFRGVRSAAPEMPAGSPVPRGASLPHGITRPGVLADVPEGSGLRIGSDRPAKSRSRRLNKGTRRLNKSAKAGTGAMRGEHSKITEANPVAPDILRGTGARAEGARALPWNASALLLGRFP